MKHRVGSRAWLTLGASAIAMLANTPVCAAATADAAGATTSVGEVIVTAEKRSVNIQKVPEAVAAFTDKQRSLIGINSVQDITNFTPGLTYSSQLDRPVIRGLARNNSIFTGDSSVGIYDNDLYSTSVFLVGRDDMIVDQVEVLLGPQNTLYGRNSIGGLINTHSRRPSETFGGEVREEIGNYDFNKVEGTVTGPVGPINGLSFRLSGVYETQNKGWYKNLSGSDIGGVRRDPYFEFQLQYKGDRDELWFMTYYQEFIHDRGGPGSTQATPSPGPYDTSLEDSGSGLFFNPNYAYSGGAVPGSVVGAIPGGNPTTLKNRIIAINQDTDINNHQYSFNFHWIHHFDGFDMKYVGGFSHTNYSLSTNNVVGGDTSVLSYQLPTTTGLPPLTVDGKQGLTYAFKTDYYSQEINFTSTTAKRFSWIAGAFYYNEQTSNPVTVNARQQAQLSASGFNVIPVSSINQYIGSVLGGAPAPAKSIFNPNQVGDFVYENYQDLVQSVAAFGQGSYKLSDTLKITGGLRYTYDKKRANEETRLIAFNSGALASLLGQATPALDVTPFAVSTALDKGVAKPIYYATSGKYAGDAIRLLEDHSDAVTGTLALEWTPDPDTLAYARYNRGYKALGFTGGVVGASPEALPETLNDYEIGLKKNINGNIQIDIAGFYYDYHNDQISLLAPVGASAFTQFLNIPKAVSDGVELTAQWNPVRHLNLSLVYGFNHTEILTDCPAFTAPLTQGSHTCFYDVADPGAIAKGAQPRGPGPVAGEVYQSVKGDPLPNSPKNKVAFNANYTFEFEPGDLTLSGTYIWRDEAYFGIFKRTQYDYAPSWSQVDMRATFADKSQHYEIVLYVKNLFDTIGFNSPAQGFFNATPQGGGAPTFTSAYDLTPPRQFGAEVHYKF